MCLIAAELERKGITTVASVLLKEVAEWVRPPRALSMPFVHGYPLGVPHDAHVQRQVLMAMLAMAQREELPPLIETYGEDDVNAR